MLSFTKRGGSSLDQSTIIARTSEVFEREWADLKQRLRSIPGKDFLSRLNDRLQDTFRISITEVMLIERLSRDQIDHDILGILDLPNAFCND